MDCLLGLVKFYPCMLMRDWVTHEVWLHGRQVHGILQGAHLLSPNNFQQAAHLT